VRRKNAAWGPRGPGCRGGGAGGVGWGGDRGTQSPPPLPERGRGYARRNADENAWERKRTCHEVTDPILDVGSPDIRLWHEADLKRHLLLSAFGVKPAIRPLEIPQCSGLLAYLLLSFDEVCDPGIQNDSGLPQGPSLR